MGIKASIAKAIGRTKFWCGGHKPEITLTLGLVTMAAGVVTACIATRKSTEVLQDAKFDCEDIDSDGLTEFMAAQNERRVAQGLEPIEVKGEIIDPEVAKKKIMHKATRKVIKYWIVPTGCIAASTLFQISTYRTLNSRLLKTAGLLAVATAEAQQCRSVLDSYRNGIVEKFGKEVDQELMETATKKVSTVHTIDPETGEVIEEIFEPSNDSRPPWEYSIYAREYTNTSYQPDLDVDRIRYIQNWANDRLITRGYVFLNEVYEALQLPIDGRFVGVGWISPEYATKSGKKLSDGYIDFGVFKSDLRSLSDDVIKWHNNETNKVMLDFNVDGMIYKYVNAINKMVEGDKDLWIADRAAFYRGKPQPHHV